MEGPILSIIVPVFNAEKTLDRCILSIISQTYKSFELILINDGSTDKSLSICSDYANKDSRIKVFDQINKGQGATRNFGISIAQGDFIGFVDSDDYIHPKMYEILMRQMINNNTDLAICARKIVSPNEMPKYQEIDINECQFEHFSSSYLIDHYWEYFLNKILMAPWNKVYKKNIIAQNLFPEGIIYEDHFILPWVLSSCNLIAITNLGLYYYVQTPNSTIRSGFSLKKLDSLKVWTESLIPFFEKTGNKHNMNIAYSYYINEFKTLSFNIVSNKYKQIRIANKYKYLYNKLLFKTKIVFSTSYGWYALGLHILSLINMKLTFHTGLLISKKRFNNFCKIIA